MNFLFLPPVEGLEKEESAVMSEMVDPVEEPIAQLIAAEAAVCADEFS